MGDIEFTLQVKRQMGTSAAHYEHTFVEVETTGVSTYSLYKHLNCKAYNHNSGGENAGGAAVADQKREYDEQQANPSSGTPFLKSQELVGIAEKKNAA